jgi:hypothetical protein
MSPLAVKAIAAGAVLLAILAGVWFIYHKGETSGGAAVTVKVQQRTIEVQRKITDAEDRAPRTPRDVSKRLRDGSF